MAQEDIRHLQELKAKYTRNLQHLELQAADYGVRPPVELINHIEDVKQQLQFIQQKLLEIENLPTEGSLHSSERYTSTDEALPKALLKEERVYRLFGIPIWSVSIITSRVIRFVIIGVCISIFTGLLVPVVIAAEKIIGTWLSPTVEIEIRDILTEDQVTERTSITISDLEGKAVEKVTLNRINNITVVKIRLPKEGQYKYSIHGFIRFRDHKKLEMEGEGVIDVKSGDVFEVYYFMDDYMFLKKNVP